MATTKKASDINYKTVVINAAVTAIASATAIALVNYFLPTNKGLGVSAIILAKQPLNIQSQYADPITMANVKNTGWLMQQLNKADLNSPNFYYNLNATSIGNCAYLVLNAPDPDLRKKCFMILENLKKHVE